MTNCMWSRMLRLAFVTHAGGGGSSVSMIENGAISLATKGQMLVEAARKAVTTARAGATTRQRAVRTASETVQRALDAGKSSFVEQQLRQASDQLTSAEQGLWVTQASLDACVTLMQALEEKNQADVFRILGKVAQDINDLNGRMTALSDNLKNAANNIALASGGDRSGSPFERVSAALRKAQSTMADFEKAVRDAYLKTRNSAM